MLFRPGGYENPTPEVGLELKERLVAWRARTLFSELPQVDTVDGVSGRLWDISRPMFQVCKLVQPEFYEELRKAILAVAGLRKEKMLETIDGKIVTLIYEMSSSVAEEWRLDTKEILDKLNGDRHKDKQLSPQWLGRKLNSMGFKTIKSHGYSKLPLIRSEADQFFMEYGLITQEDQQTQEPGDGDDWPEASSESLDEIVMARRVIDKDGEEQYQVEGEPEYMNKEEYAYFLFSQGGNCSPEKQDIEALMKRIAEGFMIIKDEPDEVEEKPVRGDKPNLRK
jgi:hypothetical protein